MISRILTATNIGLDSVIIEVEADISRGLPSFNIVGLPDKAVNEARERILTAIKNSHIELPVKKIIINLAPAYMKKEKSILDLPITAAILSALDIINIKNKQNNCLFLGELSLDGSIKKIRGILPNLIMAKNMGIKRVILPLHNLAEARLIPDLKIIPVNHIREMIEKVNKDIILQSEDYQKNEVFINKDISYSFDMSDILGNVTAKRALEIAASGMHNIMLIGPPGTGKTMLAKRLITIMPPMSFEESLETTCIYSSRGLLTEKSPLMLKRPFRSPHHTSSDISIIGGGRIPQCGEISLSHNGILFFDEFPQFKNNVIQALREPLEEAYVSVARVNSTIKFPARFLFIAASNPCPCGYYGSSKHFCSCTHRQIRQYYSKLSGPILDRIDIHIEMTDFDFLQSHDQNQERSRTIRERVMQAQKIQQDRSKKNKNYFNSCVKNNQIKELILPDEASIRLLKKSMARFNLSGRCYYKILKISRTIADLDRSEKVLPVHISEALAYHGFERKRHMMEISGNEIIIKR